MAEGGTSLSEQFDRAAAHLENLAVQLEPAQLLSLYGLYKQATLGACNTPRPGWFQVQAKHKWDAWNALGDMTKEAAMQAYIQAINRLDPGWDEKPYNSPGSAWVAVSCLYNHEEQLCDADKTLLDWIKEGNEQAVRRVLAQDRKAVDITDENGLLPVHWAADRGHASILKLLVEAKADVNAVDQDGQTPMHYAASCGHAQVVEFLKSVDAKMIEDNDGMTPKDVAAEELLSLF